MVSVGPERKGWEAEGWRAEGVQVPSRHTDEVTAALLGQEAWGVTWGMAQQSERLSDRLRRWHAPHVDGMSRVDGPIPM